MASKVSHSAIATKSYLLVDTVPAALAFPAASVLCVARAAEWNAEPPLPLGVLIPIHFSASEPVWVLRIAGSTQPIVALVSGIVRIEPLRTDTRLSMPTLNHCGFEIFSEVVLVDGRPSALVVNIDALSQVHRELGI